MGFTNTGLYIFGPTEAANPPNQAYGDPVYNNILDDCGGHTALHHNHYLNIRCFNLMDLQLIQELILNQKLFIIQLF